MKATLSTTLTPNEKKEKKRKEMKEKIERAAREVRRYYSRKVLDVLTRATKTGLDCIRRRITAAQTGGKHCKNV